MNITLSNWFSLYMQALDGALQLCCLRSLVVMDMHSCKGLARASMHIQHGAVITQSVFSKKFTIGTPYITRYGVSFVSASLGWCFVHRFIKALDCITNHRVWYCNIVALCSWIKYAELGPGTHTYDAMRNTYHACSCPSRKWHCVVGRHSAV